MAPSSPVPAHMLTGNAAARPVRAGETVTYAHVVRPAPSCLWRLREEQEKEGC